MTVGLQALLNAHRPLVQKLCLRSSVGLCAKRTTGHARPATFVCPFQILGAHPTSSADRAVIFCTAGNARVTSPPVVLFPEN